MKENKESYKLYLVGGFSVNPSIWSGSHESVLVIAQDEKEAKKIAKEPFYSSCIEIPFEKAKYLCKVC